MAAGEGETTKRSILHYLTSTLLPMDKIIFLGLDHMMFLDSIAVLLFVDWLSLSQNQNQIQITI